MQPSLNFNHRRDIRADHFSCLGMLGLLIRGTYLVITGIDYFDPSRCPKPGFQSAGCPGNALLCGITPANAGLLHQTIEGTATSSSAHPTNQVLAGFGFRVVWVIVVIIGSSACQFFLIRLGCGCTFLPARHQPPHINLYTWIGVGGIACRFPPPIMVRLRVWHGWEHSCCGDTGIPGHWSSNIVVVGLRWTVIQPRTANMSIDQIKTQVANAKGGDMQSLLTALAPYLTNPLIILSILVFASVAYSR